MKAKKYLNQIRWLTIEIESRKEELKKIREEVYGITSAKDGPRVDGSENSSKTEAAAIKLQEATARLVNTIAEREKVRVEIEETINRVEEPAERSLLLLKYRELLTWDEIAERIHYTARTAQRIHGRALQSIERILANKEQE